MFGEAKGVEGGMLGGLLTSAMGEMFVSNVQVQKSYWKQKAKSFIYLVRISLMIPNGSFQGFSLTAVS